MQQSRSEEHTSELQSQSNLVCRRLLEKKDAAAPALGSHAARARDAPPAPALPTAPQRGPPGPTAPRGPSAQERRRTSATGTWPTPLCFLIVPRPPASTLFPYTTLFRSHQTSAAVLKHPR